MLYRSILFVHIAAAVIWLGGGTLLWAAALRARGTDDARVLGDFAKTLPYVGLRVLMPSVVLLLLSGLSLVFLNPSWSFAEPWIWLALTAFALAFLIGVVYLSRVGSALERMADRSEPFESMAETISRWLRGYALVLLLLVFSLWDMVFKPGL